MRVLPRLCLALGAVALVTIAVACGANGSSPAFASAATRVTGSRAPATGGLAALRAVAWTSVTVPGRVCPGRGEPIRLSHGTATFREVRRARHPGPVVVTEATHVFGDLYGSGHDVAAVNVWCAGANGSAASQLRDSWVLYTDSGSRVRVLTTLTPRQPSSARKVAAHVPYFDTSPGGISIVPGTVTVRELWYRSADHTCCPSVHAKTVWRVHGRSFSASTSTSSSTSTTG